MLTYREAQAISKAIAASAHEIQVERHGSGRYTIRAVDDKTGYPFEVYDFSKWQERREIAKLLANDELSEEDERDSPLNPQWWMK